MQLRHALHITHTATHAISTSTISANCNISMYYLVPFTLFGIAPLHSSYICAFSSLSLVLSGLLSFLSTIYCKPLTPQLTNSSIYILFSSTVSIFLQLMPMRNRLYTECSYTYFPFVFIGFLCHHHHIYRYSSLVFFSPLCCCALCHYLWATFPVPQLSIRCILRCSQ